MILYVLVSLVLTGVVNYKQLNVSAPVVFAIERVGPAVSWTKTFFELGAVAGLSSGVLVALLAQPRILYQMAQDGLLPRIFAQVHPRFRTPSLTTLVTGAVTAVMSALFPLKLVVALVSIDGKVTNADCVQAWSDDYSLMPEIDACVLGVGMYTGYEPYWTSIQAEPDKPGSTWPDQTTFDH